MKLPKVTDKGALCSLTRLNGLSAAALTAYLHSMHKATPSASALAN